MPIFLIKYPLSVKRWQSIDPTIEGNNYFRNKIFCALWYPSWENVTESYKKTRCLCMMSSHWYENGRVRKSFDLFSVAINLYIIAYGFIILLGYVWENTVTCSFYIHYTHLFSFTQVFYSYCYCNLLTWYPIFYLKAFYSLFDVVLYCCCIYVVFSVHSHHDG